jgi:hypothetical protein
MGWFVARDGFFSPSSMKMLEEAYPAVSTTANDTAPLT